MSDVTLRELVVTEDGEDVDALLARTEGIVAALQEQFASGMQDRLDRLGELFFRGWETLATRDATVQSMRRVLHDLKGEGGTFGFDLITEISELFGGYLRETPGALQKRDAVVGYLEALRMVWNERIEGEGNVATRAMLDRLVRLSA